MNLQKDVRGSWRAETDFTLPDNSGRVLRIYTSKVFSGSLVTNAIVGMAEKHQHGESFSYMPFSDFSKCLERNDVRCTEKSVRAQQERGEARAADLITEALAFYKGKVPA
jgi:hypothetical protein